VPRGTDDLAGLKARVRLSEFIEQRVKLSPGHGDRFGLCPFHDERTASFSVNDRKGFFHCFGCEAHGDVLDWLQRMEGLSFPEAMERLRREAGERVVWSDQNRERDDDVEAAKRQAEARAIWEASQPIAGTVAEAYLREARGISIELPDCLRCHPALRLDPRGADEFPALIAAVTDIAGALGRRRVHCGGSHCHGSSGLQSDATRFLHRRST
jgi:DNA primase